MLEFGTLPQFTQQYQQFEGQRVPLVQCRSQYSSRKSLIFPWLGQFLDQCQTGSCVFSFCVFGIHLLFPWSVRQCRVQIVGACFPNCSFLYMFRDQRLKIFEDWFSFLFSPNAFVGFEQILKHSIAGMNRWFDFYLIPLSTLCCFVTTIFFFPLLRRDRLILTNERYSITSKCMLLWHVCYLTFSDSCDCKVFYNSEVACLALVVFNCTLKFVVVILKLSFSVNFNRFSFW